jgi:hypothetical protein
MKSINNPIVVVPYVYENEIQELRKKLNWSVPVVFWEDKGRIGSDLAYQTLWNTYSDRDIIILHADMLPLPEDTDNLWYSQICQYAAQFPEAGILGMTLLYPVKDEHGHYYIQHAGGRFYNGEAIHFGGGLELSSQSASRELETDKGQYDGKIREVAWVTFGGIYLRRSALADVGNFDPSYHWTYYRDVDYCLTARQRGWKIYQTPVKLLHYEGKDNKRLIANNPSLQEKWNINHAIFMKKWRDSKEMKSINIDVESGKDLGINYTLVTKDLLEKLYKNACTVESDIYKHLPVLKEYASRCNHVTEMGARTGNSTLAFLLSGADKFVSYDYQYENPEPHLVEGVEKLKTLITGAKDNLGIDATYIGADVLEVEIEQTDLLFIDTWHVYEQLREELRLHASKVNKYIAFHDIETFGIVGEGYPEMDPNHPTRDKLSSQGGIRLAIDEFLENNSDWKIVYETKENNGLMILEKSI